MVTTVTLEIKVSKINYTSFWKWSFQKLQQGEQFYCAFMGRRDGKNFVLSHEELAEKYKDNMKMQDRIPDALSGAMGNQMFVANFSTKEEMDQFYYDACLCHE